MQLEMSIGFILPFRFVTIEACNNVYLTGGDNDHGIFYKSHYLYDELRGGLISLADMNDSRSRHSLARVDDKQRIYAIGGENSSGVLKKCEYYDIAENRWIEAPKLHDPRCGLSSCTIGNSIYVIGGWNQDYLGNIERLDASDDLNKWENVKLNKRSTLKPVQVVGAIEIKDSEILIFGGYQAKETLTTDCYVLNVKNMTISTRDDMKKPEAFISSEINKIGDFVYAFGYVMGGIHFYDTTNDKWEFIPQGELVK